MIAGTIYLYATRTYKPPPPLPRRRQLPKKYLTIIPRARKGSDSIAHEAEGQMDYWLRGHEGERNNCFSKIQLVGQK